MFSICIFLGLGRRVEFVIKEGGYIYILIPRRIYSYWLSLKAHWERKVPIWVILLAPVF